MGEGGYPLDLAKTCVGRILAPSPGPQVDALVRPQMGRPRVGRGRGQPPHTTFSWVIS